MSRQTMDVFSLRDSVVGEYRKFATVMPAPESFHVSPAWVGGDLLTQWIADRVGELVCVTSDLIPFGRATLGRDVVFQWLPARREILQAELDAMAFHHFGLARDDVEHVLSTFPKVRDYDEKAHGEYRTKRVILEIYDAMAEAARTGKPYETRLDPPPADPRVAHPKNTRPEWARRDPT